MGARSSVPAPEIREQAAPAALAAVCHGQIAGLADFRLLRRSAETQIRLRPQVTFINPTQLCGKKSKLTQ